MKKIMIDINNNIKYIVLPTMPCLINILRQYS